jgi:peptide/nickel transport system substrate-binding protein
MRLIRARRSRRRSGLRFQRPPRASTALLALVASLTVAAPTGCSDEQERRGGEITIAESAQPDFLDPARSYTLNGWEPMWLVYTPLLTYRRAEGRAGTELIPGLAESLPRISPDARTYRLRLRQGVEYSDGTPVRASDFEHTIKRVLNGTSAGSHFFLGIKGGSEYVDRGRPEADITGILADDRSGDIRIELVAPDGTFAYALATTFAGLVPGDTPFKNLTRAPPPGVGPYRISRSEPNREFVLVRNRGFDLPGIPQGSVNRITVKIVTNPERQAQDVIRGRLDYMQDPPPASLLPEIRSEHQDRYREYESSETIFFFLNTRVEPFDNRDVRRAVNHALDRRGFTRIFGGLVEPTCNFLPRHVPGYRKLAPCPWPEQDTETAKRLVARAGANGAEVQIWGPSQQPGPAITSYYADALRTIGLDPKEKLVDFAVYPQLIGNEKTQAQTGFIGFGADFPHPYSYLHQFSGAAITPTANINVGNVDDPRLTAGIERLKRAPDVEAVAGRWAELERRLIEQAYVAVLGHGKRSTFLSPRMNFEDCSRVHPVYQNDYSSFCLE